MIYMKSPGKKGKPDVHPHMIILTYEDTRMLVPMMMLATLTTEVVEWLDETFEEGVWDWCHGMICFRTKEDAMGFLLRWA